MYQFGICQSDKVNKFLLVEDNLPGEEGQLESGCGDAPVGHIECFPLSDGLHVEELSVNKKAPNASVGNVAIRTVGERTEVCSVLALW